MPVTLHLTPPGPKTYKVLIASIVTTEGAQIYAAATWDQLVAKVSDYCLDCWDELNDDAPDWKGLTPEQLIDTYFDHHPNEFWDDHVRYVQSLASE